MMGGLSVTAVRCIANYVALSLMSVGVDFLALRQVFPLRHSSRLWWAYFAVKATVDGTCSYLVDFGLAGPLLPSIRIVWSMVIAVVSLGVVYYTFKGDFMRVGAVAVACDAVAGCCTLGGIALALIILGRPYGQLLLVPIDLTVLLPMALTYLTYAIIRKPMRWLCQWISRVAMTHRQIVTAIIVGFMFLSTTSMVVTRNLVFNSAYLFVFSAIVALFILLPLMLRRMHDVTERQRSLAACVDLSARYDQTVGAQLDAIEQELQVLDGHERSLLFLGSGDDAKARKLQEQARQLEQLYDKLRAGAFCSLPALDAVLTAAANRLRAAGACPSFTVAGIPKGEAVSSSAVFALLNLACGAASREGVDEGGEVELRIRTLGENLLLRLSIPASWGHLGARRVLSPFTTDTGGRVREDVRDGRTVVLVLIGGERA